MRLNDIYHDRGIQKYNGFFLSEHTENLTNERIHSTETILAKEQMSEELIFETIDFAIYKQKKISIQLNIRDIEGNFLEDITGMIKGYDEANIYLDTVKVPLNQIRHITTFNTKSWYKNEKKH